MLTALLIAAGVVAALLLFAATRPNTIEVRRSALIGAPAERIYALLDDFHRWPVWSPWEKLDPGMNRTHSGAASGKGAVYEWSGNKKVGRGRMEILETAPAGRLVIKLDFFEPFESHNTTVFSLEAAGGGTRVDWTMTGPNSFMGKLMGIFVNMDKMIGKDFDSGLANLKGAAEGLAA
ncbi:MAG: SRPBCC family protein [Gemmatimonadales bacterium]